MSRICVFDVNETLLDLRALDSHFEHFFGDVTVRQAWFAQLLQSAFVSTITGDYKDFGTIGSTALDMIATRRGVTLSPEARTDILQRCAKRMSLFITACFLQLEHSHSG